MSFFKVAYVINDAAFFVSHRLPLALSVKKKGGKVCVITGLNINKRLELDAIRLLEKHKILHRQCSFSQGFRNPILEILGLFQLIYYLLTFKPSTIHSATAKGNFMAAIATNFINGSKLILSVSGLGTMFTGNINFKKKIFVFIYKFFLNLALRNIKYEIIFQNKDDFRKFKTIIPITEKVINFIPGSGVNTSKLLPIKKITNNPNILLPARMLYEKGINEFVEASRILKKKNNSYNFYLAGDFNSINPSAIAKDKIEGWVKEGLVIYLGHQNDMESLYHQMSIVCLPSWREGFPKVLMEAASLGLPVITTNVPGCKDAIIENKTGILVPANDAVSLANAINMLFENKEMREKMGKEGRILAINKFDLSIIVPEIIKLYR